LPGPSRAIVIHADDLGMCHGANAAFAELSAKGTCSCGSIMVPCPWFLEIADMQAHDPNLDIGVHLTLNAEKRHYRWRPLTGSSPAGGLVDDDGFFWRSVPELRRHAEPEAVEAELRAQIEAAFAAGIDVTHLDDHMGSVFCPEFVDIYVRLGREYRLPILIVDSLAAYDPRHNFEPDAAADAALAQAAAEARADGSPRFDAVLETPWRRGASVEADYDALFARVPAGLTFFAMHFTAPSELQAIEPETAAIRIEEYELFRSDVMSERLASGDYAMKGMRAFRDVMRGERSDAMRRPSEQRA
jgi:predicted glycoside hydrolase/deacetylase ChbG (UPF0249 family)